MEEDDDDFLFLGNGPALLEVAKFCWRFEHDPLFGTGEPGDKVLVLCSASLAAVYCNRACKSRHLTLVQKSFSECSPFMLQEIPGVLCTVYSHKTPPVMFPGVHVVDLGTGNSSESYFTVVIDYLCTKIVCGDTLVDRLCRFLYHQWSNDEIADSGLPPELQRRIRLAFFQIHCKIKQIDFA